jgi:hypothetical protein
MPILASPTTVSTSFTTVVPIPTLAVVCIPVPTFDQKVLSIDEIEFV